MGDVGDDFRAMKAAKKVKRKGNKTTNTEMVKTWGAEVECKNNGEHLVIHGCEKLIDFWPSSGRWISRCNSSEGYNISTLFKFFIKNRCDDEQ